MNGRIVFIVVLIASMLNRIVVGRISCHRVISAAFRPSISNYFYFGCSSLIRYDGTTRAYTTPPPREKRERKAESDDTVSGRDSWKRQNFEGGKLMSNSPSKFSAESRTRYDARRGDLVERNDNPVQRRSNDNPAPRRNSDSPVQKRSNTTPTPTPSGKVPYMSGAARRKLTGESNKVEGRINNSPSKLSSKLQYEIDALFKDAEVVKHRVDEFLIGRLGECGAPHISSIMRQMGKKSKRASVLILKEHLPAIATRIDQLSTASWTCKDIAFVLYGLQTFKEKDHGCYNIIQTMNYVASVTVMQKDTLVLLTAQNLSMMSYGLQSIEFRKEDSVKL